MFLRTKSGLVNFGNCESIHLYSSQGIGSRHRSVKCPLFWWHLPGSVVFSCGSVVLSLSSTGLVILEICFVYYPPVKSQQITVNCSLYTIPIHLVNLHREIYCYCIQTEVWWFEIRVWYGFSRILHSIPHHLDKTWGLLKGLPTYKDFVIGVAHLSK